ncbi:MAG: LytTR family DNA-binding domain-containing protein [Burkholderiales bacterium]|jgi:DNA-binding LytR/AlgR family response regulator|nr:LytTR family DNA-binding domain-containing protein [Burkholderiales bacterium]
MPTALIADDEPHLADYLRAKLAQAWPQLQIVAVAGNGEEALRQIEAQRPDLAFLDIRMPGVTGLEVARRRQGAALRPRIVFVTAFDQYAVEAFDADAVDYLLKPVTDERLDRTVSKLQAALAAGAPTPDLTQLIAQVAARLPAAPAAGWLRWVRASKKSADGELTEQIAVADVLYFQADDKYTCVYARDGATVREWLIRTPLSELAARLDPERFQQIHRSVLVNMDAVAGTRRDLTGKLYVRLRETPRELPVARQYMGLFRQM